MDVIAAAASSSHNEEFVLSEIGRTGLIAILRGDLKGRAVEIVETLLQSGVTAVEVTMNSPNAFGIIRAIRQGVRASLALGAGTVLRSSEVEEAFDAGAQFIVSPNMSPTVIHATKKLGMASFPGCSTCTEILEGFDQGADAVKVFPAAAVSPEGIRTIRSSLGDLRLIPTGGITRVNAVDYFAAGAWALGIGSALVNANQQESIAALRKRADELVAAVAARRG